MRHEEFIDFLNKRISKETVIYTLFSSEELLRECCGEKFGIYRGSLTENEWDGRFNREK